MGRGPTSLLDALFPRTRQRVLGLLFGQPERSFSSSELIRLAEAGSGAVQREIERLTSSGLATVETEPRRIRANVRSPLFHELSAIFEKTAGIAEELRRALAPLENQIFFAVLYGSVAKRVDRASSDIDLLVVTDELTLEQIFAVTEHVERRLDRHVSPTLYTASEFNRRRASKHPFVTKVLESTHVVLLGNEDAIPAR